MTDDAEAYAKAMKLAAFAQAYGIGVDRLEQALLEMAGSTLKAKDALGIFGGRVQVARDTATAQRGLDRLFQRKV